jgi:hypothetical protein
MSLILFSVIQPILLWAGGQEQRTLVDLAGENHLPVQFLLKSLNSNLKYFYA